MSITINKIPKEMWIKQENISFNFFAEKFINYMEDLEDIEKVQNEMNDNSDEGFDYSVIRWNYV